MYQIELSDEATAQVVWIRKSMPQTYKKLLTIVEELREHPFTGTGRPELLRYMKGVWSRRLDKKNRIRYTVDGQKILVFIISVLGHYEDK